jgi:hypothetical protein
MTKFFIKWWVNPVKTPNTPEETGKLYLPMLEMVKADLSAGKYTDWGQFSNGREGYAISELSESEIFASMLKWILVISFDVFPVLSAEQSMEAIKQAAAAMKGQ